MLEPDDFLAVACEYQHVMRALVALLVVMAVLLAFAFPFLDPGTGAYVIALVDVGLLVGALVLVGGLSILCARREP